MPPKKVVGTKPQPKAVKARRIINVGTEGEAGASSGLPLHAAQIAKKRQLKKALEHLYTKLAEKKHRGYQSSPPDIRSNGENPDKRPQGIWRLQAPRHCLFLPQTAASSRRHGRKICVWSARQSSCQRHRVQGQGRVFDATKKLHGLSSRS